MPGWNRISPYSCCSLINHHNWPNHELREVTNDGRLFVDPGFGIGRISQGIHNMRA